MNRHLRQTRETLVPPENFDMVAVQKEHTDPLPDGLDEGQLIDMYIEYLKQNNTFRGAHAGVAARLGLSRSHCCTKFHEMAGRVIAAIDEEEA